MQSERVVETVPLSSEPATTPVPRMEASNASIPTVSSVGVLHPEDPIGNPVKPTVWPMHDRHVANIVDKPMRNIGTTVAYADTYPVTHGDGSPVTLQDVHPVHRKNLYPANHPASEPVYTPGEMMVGGTVTEADPFRKTASMRSRQTIPEDDETRKWRKHIPIHLAVIFTYEFLLSLAGIILNIWLPGVAIISALAILFTGLLFMIIAERKVKQYTFVSYYARFNFIAFFSAFLVTLFFGIWAICAAAGVAPRNVTVYLVIPSLVTFFFHILYNLSNVIFISKAVKHTDLPMREKLPQYEEVYLENDKSAMQKREPLPVYTRTAAPVGSTTAVAPAAAPGPGATVW